MKNLIVGIVIVGLVVLGLFVFGPEPQTRTFTQQGPVGGGIDFSFNTATQATSSVGIYSWTNVLSGESSRGFIALCDNADGGVNVNNPVYLGFGATSTDPYGFRLGSGECYTMTLAQDNMFYGTVYAIASSATTTLLKLYK